MSYIRKTKDEYQIMGNYGYGWECECTEETYKEAKQRMKEYRENGGGAYRLDKKRIKLTVKEQLKNLGITDEQIDSHESDLYVLKNEISESFVGQYDFKQNVTTFKSEIDGMIWYDIPFANSVERFNR